MTKHYSSNGSGRVDKFMDNHLTKQFFPSFKLFYLKDGVFNDQIGKTIAQINFYLTSKIILNVPYNFAFQNTWTV